MTIKTAYFYPSTVTQTSGGKYRTFKDLNVIKDTGNGYAESNGNIKSKKSSPNRPSTITATKFNCKLPVGAVVNKITVELKHSKTGTSNKKSCNIGAPTVSLLYNDKVISSKLVGGLLYNDKVISSNLVSENWLASFSFSKKGQAPKMVADTSLATFNGKYSAEFNTWSANGVTVAGALASSGIISNIKLPLVKKKISTTYDMPSRTKVNDNSFGVRINYPTNTNTYTGKIRIWWVRLKIEYTLSTYTLKMEEVPNNSEWGYNNEEYHVKLSLSRTSKTGYVPSVTITTPLGFSFKGTKAPVTNILAPDNTGTVEQISSNVLKYTPALTSKNETGTVSVELVFDVSVTYASGSTVYTGTFEAVESLNNASATHTASISDRPVIENEVDIDTDIIIPDSQLQPTTQEIIFAQVNQHFHIFPQFTTEEIENSPIFSNQLIPAYVGKHFFILITYDNPNFEGNLTKISQTNIYEDYIDEDGNWTTELYGTVAGQRTIQIRSGTSSSNSTLIREIDVEIYPTLSSPSVTLLRPSEEEIDRLGDGYSYTVQSYLKEITSDAYVRDWGHAFRIGVFNNRIEENITTTTIINENGETETIEIDSTDYTNLSIDELINNAEYWSNPPTNINEYSNLECHFMYDEDYPLYILIIGDYPEATTMADITFTEPVIIETANYTGRNTECKFPIPLKNLITDTDTASITLSQYQQSNSFVLYELPVEENFGTNDLMAVRGIAITGNIEQSDELVLNAKLKSPTGNIGQRSLIINEKDGTDDYNSFTIGGIGDLWGFGMLDLTNLKEWGFELYISNILENNDATITMNDLNIIVYLEEITIQNINIAVEGEDLSFYNCFITDVQIPPGLDTDVDFLTIDGTDTNDAYRQNIKEKEISIELTLGDGCNLESSTYNLRQLTKLLTNEKDKYNRPIPKRIEFSNMPDVYFEYILKDSPEATVDINDYNVKIKLIVPAGTSYARNNTVTNTIGFIQGLASVQPVVTFTPIGDDVEIVETITGQKFQINYTNWSGKIVEIDCEDMIVWLKENNDDTNPVNITSYCDINNDWFRLHGEYRFEATNAILRTVDYTERW